MFENLSVAQRIAIVFDRLYDLRGFILDVLKSEDHRLDVLKSEDHRTTEVPLSTAEAMLATVKMMEDCGDGLLAPNRFAELIRTRQFSAFRTIVEVEIDAQFRNIWARVRKLEMNPASARFGNIASLLAPPIRDACTPLAAIEHYREAVLKACDILNDLIRQRTGLALDGVELANEAFGAKGLLAFAVGTDRTSLNLRDGYANILRGVEAAIRNTYVHGGSQMQLAREDALSHMVTISDLYRRVEAAAPNPARGRDAGPSTP